MEEKHRRILRRLRLELAGQLQVDQVVQYLYQERVLSLSFLEELLAEPVTLRRSLKLLDHLPSRGARAFPAFARSLREEFPWLCRRLEEEERVEEEQPAPPAVLSTTVLQTGTFQGPGLRAEGRTKARGSRCKG
ncbi:death domain-containing protein CRADD isoform X2 [Heterodontus francisci]|uniref:death domain-containing protein CRADD isoform X2 n=1 Tax=Heterodontus francisci TaxID=7792 RepID=UPI00355BFAB7